MNELPTPAPVDNSLTPGSPAETPKPDPKLKRAGASCITLFVVFLISLLSFGQKPYTTYAQETGNMQQSGFNVNIISCLGVVLGVYAIFFLLFNWKKILKLTPTRKVLGLIGAIGLIAHTAFAIFMPLSFPAFGSPSMTQANSGQMTFDPRGPETWRADGKNYDIASTYFLIINGKSQFTIEFPYRFTPADAHMNDERALEIVFPIMKYAYENNLHNRTEVTKVGEGKMKAQAIGVALFEKQGDTVRGYRVALPLEEIKKRLK